MRPAIFVRKEFALLLGVATVLCVLGFLYDDYTLMLACMLISPILDLPLDIVLSKRDVWSRLAMLVALPTTGFLVGKLAPRDVSHKNLGNPKSRLNMAGRAYAENAPRSYIVSAVVAIVCGVLLKQSADRPILAVAINLATALLPQCVALGYYAAVHESSSDMLACVYVFAINVGGLVLGAQAGM